MAPQVNNNSSQPDNSQLLADALAKIQQEDAEALKLIPQLRDLLGQAASIEAIIGQLQNGDFIAWQLIPHFQDMLNKVNAQINAIEGRLEVIDPNGIAAFKQAISSIESGACTVAADNANLDEDLSMFSNYLDKICEAMKFKITADLYRSKMDQDNDKDLLSDAMKVMQAANEEGAILNGLQTAIGNDLVTLNSQKNKAQTDLDDVRWYNWLNPFQTEKRVDKDEAIIANSKDMMQMITSVMADLAPEIAATQNQGFVTAALTLDRVMQKLIAILANTDLTPKAKGDQIKVLLAFALTILSMIQSDAAQEKAQDQQTESKSTTFAVQMNISDQQAKLQQLENDLDYANTMGTLMQIAKPLMEVGGCLLAPGMGSFLVMALFTIADNLGLQDKLTEALSKAGLGDIGAQVFVGGLEVATTVGGGGLLDKCITEAGVKALAATATKTTEAVAKVVDETVLQVCATLGKEGDAATEAAVRKVVTQAVDDAAKSAVKKTVEQFNTQAAGTLIPQLIASRSISLSTAFARAAEKNCVIAAEEAAKSAGQDIKFLAEAAGKGATITPEEIQAVSNRAANEAVASISGAKPKDVAVDSEKPAYKKALARATATGLYNAFNDGAFSAAIKALQKANNDDDKSIEQVADIIKIIEGILASLTVAAGTGSAQTAFKNSSLSNLLYDGGRVAQDLGMAGQGISLGGQAEAENKQADAVEGISKISSSNQLLQNLLKEFETQANIDRKHAENQFAEQASNYTLISQLENNYNELANVLSASAV